MLPLIALLAIALRLEAGVIQGVIIEQASGRPISRTIVRLEAVPGGATIAVVPMAVRTGRSGQFTFPAVAPGLYLLKVLRQGYFPAAYGQRLPIGRGTPIEVTTDSKLFAEIRVRRKGALTGVVQDENGIAAPGVQVVAYRARMPLRSAGLAISDDRGVYRIHGLDPGKYWVRSAAHTLEDGTGWLPTYSPQGRETRDARIHRVTVDAETAYADVTPDSGTLLRLGGTVICDRGGSVTVIASSETGRRSTQTGCGGMYRFEGLAPANYEVFATLQDGTLASFVELHLSGNMDGLNISLQPVPAIEFEVRRSGSNAVTNIPYKLVGRRQDMAETESEQEIKGSRVLLAPGHWEFRATQVPAGQYVESIGNPFSGGGRRARLEGASDWFDVLIDPRGTQRIRVVVSDRAGRISGKVMQEGKGVPGAPVFLWPVADSARRSIGGRYLLLLSDVDGRFNYDSLPPGEYRMLASFDVDELDEDLIELSKPVVVKTEAGQTASVDLSVWVAP